MAESFTVRTPVEGYSGLVAGVVFDAGRAVVDGSQTSALRYFRDAGYIVEANVSAPQVTVTSAPGHATVSGSGTTTTATGSTFEVTFDGTGEVPPAKPAPAKKAPAKKKAAARKAPARKRGQA